MERHVYSYPARALRTKNSSTSATSPPRQWPTGEVEGQIRNTILRPNRGRRAQEPFPSISTRPPPSSFCGCTGTSERHKRFAELAFSRHPQEELYDLRNDPHQLQNVADDPSLCQARQRLRRQLNAELKKSNDPRVRISFFDF